MRDNDTITKKVCADWNNFALGKNGDYMPSSLGGRLTSVDRQWVSECDEKFHDSITLI